MKKKFEKIYRVRLPFDGRHKDPNKNYGIHGFDIWFILKGPKGAIEFSISLGLFLPHVEKELKLKYSDSIGGISGKYISYHSPVKQFKGQKLKSKCPYINGNKRCYSDSWYCDADEWVKEIFSKPGMDHEDKIWEKLKKRYEDLFESK